VKDVNWELVVWAIVILAAGTALIFAIREIHRQRCEKKVRLTLVRGKSAVRQSRQPRHQSP